MDCKKIKRLDDFYSQLKTKVSGENYFYYTPRCKACTSKRSYEWEKRNPEKRKEYNRTHNSLPHRKAKTVAANRKWREQGSLLEWQRNNKDKLKKYREKRQASKQHDISEEELDLLYRYSDSSCMYCGISEEESIRVYEQRLHRDHAINNGSDGIENCVLACKRCNSTKGEKDWDEWFMSSKDYCHNRYRAIIEWLLIWEVDTKKIQ